MPQAFKTSQQNHFCLLILWCCRGSVTHPSWMLGISKSCSWARGGFFLSFIQLWMLTLHTWWHRNNIETVKDIQSCFLNPVFHRSLACLGWMVQLSFLSLCFSKPMEMSSFFFLWLHPRKLGDCRPFGGSARRAFAVVAAWIRRWLRFQALCLLWIVLFFYLCPLARKRHPRWVLAVHLVGTLTCLMFSVLF